MKVFFGAVGLFLVVLFVGIVGPSNPIPTPGARTSHIAYSELAEQGQSLYASQGCAFCHTQMVRPVVADVGLGPLAEAAAHKATLRLTALGFSVAAIFLIYRFLPNHRVRSRSVLPENFPVFRPRYWRIAPDSKIEIGPPSGPSGSTIAGIRLFGEMSRNPGRNCSPLPILTERTS